MVEVVPAGKLPSGTYLVPGLIGLVSTTCVVEVVVLVPPGIGVLSGEVVVVVLLLAACGVLTANINFLATGFLLVTIFFLLFFILLIIIAGVSTLQI